MLGQGVGRFGCAMRGEVGRRRACDLVMAREFAGHQAAFSDRPEPHRVEAFVDQIDIAITGASSGIERATARLLAERGSAVVLGARREEVLAGVAAEIAAAGGQASFRATDVTADGGRGLEGHR